MDVGEHRIVERQRPRADLVGRRGEAAVGVLPLQQVRQRPAHGERLAVTCQYGDGLGGGQDVAGVAGNLAPAAVGTLRRDEAPHRAGGGGRDPRGQAGVGSGDRVERVDGAQDGAGLADRPAAFEGPVRALGFEDAFDRAG